MKSVYSILVCSAVAGLCLGAAIAWVEASSGGVSPVSPASKTTTDEQPGSGPKIGFSEEVFEFDRMERGTSMRHEFPLKNSGDKPLDITFVSNTCKCTSVELGGKQVKQGTKITLAPGEESSSTLEWVAMTPPGPYRHGATFVTNDPEHSRVQLTVNGQVVESTSIQPSEIVFGSISAGKEGSLDLYLMSFLDGDEVEVIDYEVEDEELAQQFDLDVETAKQDELPNKEAKTGLKLTATFHTGDTLGPFHGKLILHTNLAKAQKITVPMIGWVTGDISIYGTGWISEIGLLRMGAVDGAVGKSVPLNIAVRGEYAATTEFEVESVDPPELQVELGKRKMFNDELAQVPLRVIIPPGTRSIVRMGEPASSDAEVVLRSSHPNTPRLRIHVQFAVE